MADPVTWGLIGGSLISGLFGNSASKRAANAQITSTKMGIEANERYINAMLALTNPARSISNNALSQYASVMNVPLTDPRANVRIGQPTSQPSLPSRGDVMQYTNQFEGDGAAGVRAPGAAGAGQPGVFQGTGMAGFFNSPNYLYTLAEQEKALDRSAFGRTGHLSGGAARDFQANAAGLASNEYQNYLANLLNLVQPGAGQTSQAAGTVANAGGQVAGMYQDMGNASATSYMNRANSINNAIQGGLQNWFLHRALKAPAVPGGGGGGGGSETGFGPRGG